MTPRISCEFFPPRTPGGMRALPRTARRLSALPLEYCSVTYGAGGSTREGTFEAVQSLLASGIAAAPHLSFGSDDEATIAALLERYRDAGVRRVVALRGDVASGMGRRHVRYAAELVAFIRQRFGDAFHVAVACYPETHPESATPADDVAHFRDKVQAGADSAITQYFYNADAYFDFRDRCAAAGIGIPIVPGVMPITNVDGLVRFSNNCGAEIPRWIHRQLDACRHDEAALLAFGTDVVSRLCERLLAGGAPGLHFYTLNQASPTLAIARNLHLAG
jgi:methylenetetrahydrofolate reductase (NADPH)